jgi:hypothetical protein
MSISQIEQEIDNIIEHSTSTITTDMTSTNTPPDTLCITNPGIPNSGIPNPELNSGEIDVFNTALHQYLRINEEIKTLMQAIKARNEIKRNLGETLSSFLRTNQIKNVNLDGSYKGKRLESVVTNTVTGFNRANVTEAIYNELKEDQEVFDKIMQALSKTSVMKEVWKLKITEEKQNIKKSTTSTTSRHKKQQQSALDEADTLLQNT